MRKSKPKAGTYRFHCYASLYVIRRNKRYTLAVTILDSEEKVIAALKRLVAMAEELGLRFKRLLLDRGFDFMMSFITFKTNTFKPSCR